MSLNDCTLCTALQPGATQPWRCSGMRHPDCLFSVRVGSLVLNWTKGMGGVMSSLQGASASSLQLTLQVSLRCWLISYSAMSGSYSKSKGICYKCRALVSPLCPFSCTTQWDGGRLALFLRISQSSARLSYLPVVLFLGSKTAHSCTPHKVYSAQMA